MLPSKPKPRPLADELLEALVGFAFVIGFFALVWLTIAAFG